MFADGVLLGSGDNWSTTTTVTVPANTSVVTLRCRQLGGKAGIIASGPGGLVTDASWRCGPVADAERETWAAAYEVGPHGMEPWGARPGVRDEAFWIWDSAQTWDNNLKQNLACEKVLADFIGSPPSILHFSWEPDWLELILY